MTIVKIFRKNNNIVGYIASGHSSYSEYGTDIVCAAVSTALQLPILGMQEILKIKPELTIDENGYLEVNLRNLDKENLKKLNLTLETMVLFIRDLAMQYPKNIKLVEKEDK